MIPNYILLHWSISALLNHHQQSFILQQQIGRNRETPNHTNIYEHSALKGMFLSYSSPQGLENFKEEAEEYKI